MSDWKLDGLTAVGAKLRRLALDDIDYVVVQFRDGENWEQVGRTPYTLDALQSPDAEGYENDLPDLAQQWVQETILDNRYQGGEMVFRVRVYSAKGDKVLVSHAIRVTPHHTATPSVAMDRVHVQIIEDARAVVQLILSSARQMLGMHQSQNAQLNEFLLQARAAIDQLMAALLTTRSADLQIEQQKLSSEATAGLGKQAIDQIGKLLQMLAIQHGIDPEVGELLNTLMQHEGLRTRLRDPKVRELLNQPDTADAICQFIDFTLSQKETSQNAS